MTRRSVFPSSRLLSLSLALVLAGIAACANGPKSEESQTPAPNAEATPGAQGQAAPAPGQPGSAPGAPGATPAKPADTSKMPAVVARCNGEEIKKEDLLKQAELMRARFAQESGGRQVPALDEAFYKEVLDSIIAQNLILQDAARQGVTVSDEELKPQMDAMRRRFPDQAAFEKALTSEGLTEKALQEKLRQEAVIQKYIGTKVFTQISVTDEAAKEFYDQNQAQMQRPERAHLRHILVGVEPSAPEADKQKARDKAEDLLERAKAGEDFAKLAAEGSDDPGSKGRGGDLGWVARGQTVPPFEQAAFALTKPNELSGVVESQYGYHVIQLLEKQAASPVPFEEAKGQITRMLKQRQAGEKIKAHVEALKSKGKVEVFL